ncbi:MAG: hypothetical protein ABFD64_08360 [Armatimonadota bacterium]
MSWWNGKSSIKQILLITAVIAVIIFLLLLIGDLLLNRAFSTKTEPVDLATVSRWSSVDFPSDAKLQHSLGIRHGGIDFELYAEVEIDQKDVDPLVASLGKSNNATISRKDRLQITNSTRNWREDMPVPAWWNPDSAKYFIAVASAPAKVMISLDDAKKATVWVHMDTDRPQSTQ